MPDEASRKIKRKKVELPGGGTVNIAVIETITFLDTNDRGQELQFGIDNSSDSDRTVRIANIPGDGADTQEDVGTDSSEEGLKVERIDKWTMTDVPGRGQETQFSPDNKTISQPSGDAPPYFTTHKKTHIVKYVNSDDDGSWIKSELIDEFDFNDGGDRGQDTFYTLFNPPDNDGIDGLTLDEDDDGTPTIAVDESVEEISSGLDPVRTDPFQNIVDTSSGLWMVVRVQFTQEQDKDNAKEASVSLEGKTEQKLHGSYQPCFATAWQPKATLAMIPPEPTQGVLAGDVVYSQIGGWSLGEDVTGWNTDGGISNPDYGTLVLVEWAGGFTGSTEIGRDRPETHGNYAYSSGDPLTVYGSIFDSATTVIDIPVDLYSTSSSSKLLFQAKSGEGLICENVDAFVAALNDSGIGFQSTIFYKRPGGVHMVGFHTDLYHFEGYTEKGDWEEIWVFDKFPTNGDDPALELTIYGKWAGTISAQTWMKQFWKINPDFVFTEKDHDKPPLVKKDPDKYDPEKDKMKWFGAGSKPKDTMSQKFTITVDADAEEIRVEKA